VYNDPGQTPKVVIQEEKVSDSRRLSVAPCSVTLYVLEVQ